MKANVEKVYKRHSGQRDQKASPDASSGAGSGAGSDGSGGGRQELNSVVLFLRLEPSRGLAFARDLTLAVVGGLQELWVLLSQLGPKLRAEQGLALGSRTFLQLGMSAAEKALDEELAAYRYLCSSPIRFWTISTIRISLSAGLGYSGPNQELSITCHCNRMPLVPML